MKRKALSALIALTLVSVLTACSTESVNKNDAGKEQNGTQATSTQNDVTSTEPTNTQLPDAEAPDAQSQQTTTTTSSQDQKPTVLLPQGENITKDRAKKIAFDHAGVTEADVYGLEAEFDFDDGVESYEIEFRADGTEYDYDIHALTGEILKAEKDGKDNKIQTPDNTSRKTAEEAKGIAFDHAGVTADSVYDLEVELDEDDGVISYEIEFKSERTEYKYDIHALTGEILKSEKERDID